MTAIGPLEGVAWRMVIVLCRVASSINSFLWLNKNARQPDIKIKLPGVQPLGSTGHDMTAQIAVDQLVKWRNWLEGSKSILPSKIIALVK